MRWVQSEYLLKGIFLGLLFYVALQDLDWAATGRVALWTVGGLVAGLVLAALRQVRDLKRLGSNPLGFFLFLLLENPLLIYAGVILGLAVGAVTEDNPAYEASHLLTYFVLGGAVLGYGFGMLHTMSRPMERFAVALAVGAGLVAAGVWWLQQGHFLETPEKRAMLGVHVLIGLPFFYLLVFVGRAEESEAEIGALCAALGMGIWLLEFPKNLPAAGFLIPVALYYAYSTRVLPGLRVFKHVLRGYSYVQLDRIRPALLSFRRALQLDPRSQLARQGMRALHRSLDPEMLTRHPEIVELLDFGECLGRVEELLLQRPTPEQASEAKHLLDIVSRQRPQLQSHVDYYRAVAAVHDRDLDAAVALLGNLLDPTAWPGDDRNRRLILFRAWQLALLLHPDLRRRVGEPQLELPGRRMEAIAAVERQLAKVPDDPAGQELRQLLYEGLTERDYFDAAAAGVPEDFSHEYAEFLGRSLIDDPARWQRGAEYLRIAAHGLPLRAPAILAKLAEAHEKAGDLDGARRAREHVREVGLAVGVANLPGDQRQIFFATVKRLADDAAARGDFDAAIENYGTYTHSEINVVETLRTLADMYERRAQSGRTGVDEQADVAEALRVAEKALVHNGKDADLLERKDRYYYSLSPAKLREIANDVRPYFDVNYCVRKARQLLDSSREDLDVLDWAAHLSEAATILQPKNVVALVQLARCRLRQGDRDEGLRILEDVREMTPSGGEEQDAWYFACKQLGKLYLDELNRADLAVGALLEYEKYYKSGAETVYDLARAYEAVGDRAAAIRRYKQVTGYEGHPLVWEAEDALRRLRAEAQA